MKKLFQIAKEIMCVPVGISVSFAREDESKICRFFKYVGLSFKMKF